MLRTEVGPHSSKITIENGIGPQNKDWFWISVNVANSSLCSFLTEYDIDAGFEVDTTCSSSVYNCSTQKDNTFFMYKSSSGRPYPIYKGDMTVNKDLSAPICGLLLKDGHFTANANIELKDLTSDGLMLAAGKTITAENVGINAGETLIESGVTLNAELSAYSSSEATTTLINQGTIKDVYQFPRYVENYGEIYGDGVYSYGKELINKGTLHAEDLEFEKIENSGTIILYPFLILPWLLENLK